jgi:hypothetical protein
MLIMNGDIGCTTFDLRVIASTSYWIPSRVQKLYTSTRMWNAIITAVAPEVWAYLGVSVYAEEKGKEAGVLRPLQPHPLVVMRCLLAKETFSDTRTGERLEGMLRTCDE